MPVLVRERLMAALDVDDAEPASAERDPGSAKVPRSFGPRWVIESVMRSSTPGSTDLARGPADLDHSTDSAHLLER